MGFRPSVYRFLVGVRPAALAVVLKQLLGVTREVVTTADGAFWVDPASYFGQELIGSGECEPGMIQTLKRCLKPGGVFVDLGANEGYFSIIAAKLVESEGRVVAIEPQGRLQEVLTQNIRINDIRNITISPVAISDREGVTSFFLSPDVNSGTSGFSNTSKVGARKHRVPTRTLSAVLHDLGVDRVDLLKVDIEGAEVEAIMGSADLFRERRVKAIALEFHPSVLSAKGCSGDGVIRLLRECGYDHTVTPMGGNDLFVLQDEVSAAT